MHKEEAARYFVLRVWLAHFAVVTCQANETVKREERKLERMSLRDRCLTNDRKKARIQRIP